MSTVDTAMSIRRIALSSPICKDICFITCVLTWSIAFPCRGLVMSQCNNAIIIAVIAPRHTPTPVYVTAVIYGHLFFIPFVFVFISCVMPYSDSLYGNGTENINFTL